MHAEPGCLSHRPLSTAQRHLRHVPQRSPDYGHLYTPDEYAVTWERIGGMDTREVLLPKTLRSAGYRCGIFGKWDLGCLRRFLPLQRGWDEFYGFVNTGIDYQGDCAILGNLV